MPAQKNQHFVPRCLLKPFSREGNGLAINLYNLRKKRAVRNAPVKGQCARDYMYGKDLKLENLLARLEGNYARVLARLSAGEIITDDDKKWLQLFVAVQARRTDWAIQEIKRTIAIAKDKVFERAPEQRPEEQDDVEIMHFSLKLALDLKPYTDDLTLVILRNRTGTDFVICDNPALLTNRFHLQKLKQRRFGFTSSGAILSMPMSPRLSMFWYDKSVYSLSNASGTPYIEIDRAEDVEALNELQLLSADQNVYFSRWEEAAFIGAKLEELSAARANAGNETQVFVRDQTIRDKEIYRRGSRDEEKTARESLIATGYNFPEPTTWVSMLKFRDKPKVFSDGSAVG